MIQRPAVSADDPTKRKGMIFGAPGVEDWHSIVIRRLVALQYYQDASGNIYDAASAPIGATPLPASYETAITSNPSATPAASSTSTYSDSTGASVSDSGSGAALTSVLNAVASLGGTAIKTLGPANSGIATNQGFFGGLFGGQCKNAAGQIIPCPTPSSGISAAMIGVLAVLAVAAYFVFKQL